MPRVTIRILSCLLPISAFAQERGVELRLESTSLEVGEAVDAQLVLTNVGEPELPTITAPPGLEVQITSPRPSQSSQISIVNNRRSQTVTYVYALRVTGKKEGVYTLGPILVSAGGSSHQTAPAQITVKAPSAAARAQGDLYLFAKIEVAPATVYVTQSFTATLVIGIRKIEIDGRVTEVGNLLEFIDGGASDLSVFGARFASSELGMNDSAGVRHAYILYKTTKEVRAEEVGTFTVGPVFLKMNYPTALRRGFFGSVEASRSRKETARAPAVQVEVKGPPEQGRPADYTGAIGQYSFKVDVKPLRVELGHPFTLSLAIAGSPLDGVAGPELARYSELASRFDFAPDELTGDVENNAKVFRRAIFPKQQGEQTIPPISWSYFDLPTERYVTLTSRAIPVVVDPPPAGAAPAPSFQDSNTVNGGHSGLTVVTGGIAPNFVDADLVLADQSIDLRAAPSAGILLAPPMLWAGVTVVTRHRRRLRTDPGFARRRFARRQARRRMQEVLRSASVADQWSGLAHVLTGFLCDRFNRPPGELTPDDVRSLLLEHHLEASLVDEMSTFLEGCDAARYAPGAVGSTSPAQMADRLREWLDRIERDAR